MQEMRENKANNGKRSTARGRAGNTLEARLRALLDALPDSVVTLDHAGRITALNATGVRTFGYRLDDVVGRSLAALAAPAHREELEAAFAHAGRSGNSDQADDEMNLEAQRKDGARFPALLRLRTMHHGDDMLVVGVFQDVSLRRRMEERARQKVAHEVGASVNRLASASAELLAATMQQVTGTQEQAAAVTQAMATVDEVAQTSEQSAQRAKMVAESSQRSVEVSSNGRRAVEETVQITAGLKDNVETIAENILALAEQAQAIGEIIASVSDLADQSNLLALNAAIEASRAGEHGRGFQVVATEVKALAEQSKKATIQVRQILGDIQKKMNKAVLATEQGTRSADRATHSVMQAGEIIKILAVTISDSAQAAAQISASAGQQATGMAQISQAMRDIQEVTTQNVASNRQIERTTQDLNALSSALKESISV